MIRTEICDLLGIEYPIFQGGMAWVAGRDRWPAAVSNAGGLGIIAGMNSNGEQLRAEIQKIREITDKPFGVNVMLLSPFADEVAQVVVEEKVPVVVTGAGLPSKYIKNWVENGLKVIPVVPSVAIARMCERMGACAVVAEGGESGGHVGDLTTMTLVPQVVDAVKIPVLAAGGIGDGRGVAAAFMLGAKGVQVGTRFLVADECTHPRKLQAARAARPRTSTPSSPAARVGHPARGLKSPVTRKMQELEYSPDFTAEEFEKMGVGAMRKAAREGDEQNGSFMCGQIAGMVEKEQPAKEIIEEMFSQAEALLKGASQWVK